jgi:hypothetical protein
MTFKFRTRTNTHWIAPGIALALACATASCAPLDNLRAVDFELTGRVLDADTKEPIDGAYVIAAYKIVRVGPAAVASFCVKTKGMYTGKDGSYHFPVEKLDGRSPYLAQAIKSGYYWKKTTARDSEPRARQDAAAYGGWDIFLKKQDPAKPDFQLGNGEEVCVDAPTIEAAAAGIEYLRLELAEMERYGRGEQQRSGIKGQIEWLERLHTEAAKQK